MILSPIPAALAIELYPDRAAVDNITGKNLLSVDALTSFFRLSAKKSEILPTVCTLGVKNMMYIPLFDRS